MEISNENMHFISGLKRLKFKTRVCPQLCNSRKYLYSPHRRFFVLHPTSPLLHSLLLKFWLLRLPFPKEFPMTFHGVGVDFLWNHTFSSHCVIFSGKLYWFDSRTCSSICRRSEKDASRENETTGTANIRAIWKRSRCGRGNIQVRQRSSILKI